MIEPSRRENPNLTQLKTQMKDMSQDFEDMKNARVESKKKLEQRFADTYSEIAGNRAHAVEQMARVNDTLNAFERDFVARLEQLGASLKDQINQEGQHVRQQWAANHERMDRLEQMINREREDRIRYHDDNLNPIRAQVATIQDGLAKEKKDRVAGEKKVLRQIMDESKAMQNDIKRESVNR